LGATLVKRYWVLLGAIALGAVLRFWHLDGKPLWLDEVITVLFSLGRSVDDVPLGQVFTAADLSRLFTLQPAASCAQIAQTIAVQSVHPPLFFCWLHSWLGWVQDGSAAWIWKLRALPALIGVVAIAALYQLNRSLFSRRAGLLGAAFMAVSPFAVYLSQEARHYTLPMLFVIFALTAMVQIQSDLETNNHRYSFWIIWILVNGIGFYIHYFFILSFIAQVITLVSLKNDLRIQKNTLKSKLQSLTALALAVSAVCLLYLPWLPTFLGHISRPETDWMRPTNPNWVHAIAPLYQLLGGWFLMLIAFPVNPWGLAIGIPMTLMALGIGWIAIRRIRRLWWIPETALATRSLTIYVLVVVAEFLAIAYILGKDLTQVPRYNFIYFPAICALLGVSFAVEPTVAIADDQSHARRLSFKTLLPRLFSPLPILLLSVLSSGFIVANVVLQKPYEPDQLAVRMYMQPELPRLMVMGYQDLQDVALGLSFSLAVRDYGIAHPDANRDSSFVFLDRRKGYDSIWTEMAKLRPIPQSALDLWFIAPGLRQKDFRSEVALTDATGAAKICTRDPDHYYRLGIPYQRYRCP
jgi:uncharacterized membrane protein